MSSKPRSRSMEHIGSALVPPAVFAAVPTTPPPTPPPPVQKKKFWKRKKTPSPSPIFPALMGVNITAKAIGLSLDTSSARTSPDRSSQIRDTSLASQEYDGHSPSPIRSRTRKRSGRQGREMAVDAQVVHSAASENFQAPPGDNYSRLSKEDQRKQKATRPKQVAESPELSIADMHEFGYEIEERQRQLEEKVQTQNEETREMVREVMTRQHENSLRRSHRNSDASYDPEEFDEDDQVLMDENSRLIKKNTSLVEQNKHLHAIAEALKGKGKKGSPRTQVEAVLSENDILRETVQRLNTELAKFQEKYGNLPNKAIPGMHIDMAKYEPKSKWLTDAEYLSPLFISYDAQLREKDGIIRTLKDHQDPDTKRRWDNLLEQNNLITEEVQILMQQMETVKEKAKQASTEHAREAARQSKAFAVASAEAEVSTEMVAKLQNELGDLKKKHEKIVAENAEKIPAKEHVTAVNSLKQEIEAVKEATVKEMAEAMKKIKAIEQERSSLTLELTDSKIKNKQLEGQIEALTQAYDKFQDRCKVLNSELEEADKRNAECETHLSEVLRLMDKASAERDALAALVEKEQKVTEKALRKTMLGKWEMGKMEQTVREYKRQAAGQMNEITDKIRGLEESHQGRLKEYHREMAHLRRILQQKQAALDDVTHEKRLIENELENVWQATTSENHPIMDAFSKSKVLE